MDIEALLTNKPVLHVDVLDQPSQWGLEDDVIRFIDRIASPGCKTLETGSGISTVAFAIKKTEHICITGDYKGEVGRIRDYYTSQAIATDAVRFIVGRSEYVLPGLDVRDLDIVLIDGRHGFPAPVLDWFYTAGMLRIGGIVILDDISLWSVRILKDFLLGTPGWALEETFGRAAAFRKLEEGSQDAEADCQPYVMHMSHPGRGGIESVGPQRGLRRRALRAATLLREGRYRELFRKLIGAGDGRSD